MKRKRKVFSEDSSADDIYDVLMKRLFDAEAILLDLLKISLWQGTPQMDYSCVSGQTWLTIYQISKTQGVQILAFGGVIQLPEEWQPDEILMLTWAANTRLLEKKALRNTEKVTELNHLFRARNVNMLLLKGMGLAAFYPQPLYREYGDIDIFLYGNHAEGDLCLQSLGMMIKDIPKHTTFRFKGIPVENHRTFINLVANQCFFTRKRKQAFERVERALHKILSEEGTRTLGEEIKVPSATFNFIFITMHAGMHLADGLVVRHLCDWACFLAANKGKYDERRIETILKELNFGKLTSLMTDAAISYLGMPVEFAPSFYYQCADKYLVEKFFYSLFHHFPGSKQVTKNTVWCKWKRFWSKQWKYDLVYNEHFPERFCRTMFVWLKNILKYKKRKNGRGSWFYSQIIITL